MKYFIVFIFFAFFLLSCGKDTCYDCVAKDSNGKVVSTSVVCDRADRDAFLNLNSTYDADCYPHVY